MSLRMAFYVATMLAAAGSMSEVRASAGVVGRTDQKPPTGTAIITPGTATQKPAISPRNTVTSPRDPATAPKSGSGK